MNDCKQRRQAPARYRGPFSRPIVFHGPHWSVVWAVFFALILSGCGQDHSGADQPSGAGQAAPAHPTVPTAQATAEQLQAATAVTDKRRLTDFALTDHHGQTFNRERLLGQWSLVFFGFTRCPDICPPTLTQLSAIVKRLPSTDTTPVRIVFVSVDPTVDTPEVMARYVQGYNDRITGNQTAQTDAAEYITGVTGDERQIRGLAAQLGVHYSVTNAHAHHMHGADSTEANTQTESPEADTAAATETEVDHSGTVLLLDPEAYLHAVFAPPLPDIQALMTDIAALTGATADTDAP